MRVTDWLPLVVLPGLVWAVFPSSGPAWALMWSLAIAIYVGCKWMTWSQAPCDAPTWKHVAYLVAWPGMNATTFCTPPPTTRKRSPSSHDVWATVLNVVVGAVLLFGIARYCPPTYGYVTGWIGMAGVILILHFGIFRALGLLWRSFGIDAAHLMDAPLSSSSVSEFWGRRWNTAFRDLTAQYLFRPLRGLIGAAGALWIGFFVSGVIHDVVISVPARGGYGGPTLFFLLQALAITVSRTTTGRRLHLRDGLPGRLFTACVVLGPVFLLFHPPFVTEVVLPFMKAIGAIT